MAKQTTSRPSPPANRPNPIQNFQFTADDFKEPSRINLLFQQLIPAVNGIQGVAGPSVLPSGIDVKGSTVSGLGAPQSPSDAISSGHAEGNYSAPVLSPQLDIGGDHALKGLSNLYLNFNSLSSQVKAIMVILAVGTGISGTVTLAKITGGGANGSLTFVNGIISAFTAPT